jgi:PAS domain S-box-containing protein
MDHEKVNILLVDDQPATLLAYEVVLNELGENLAVATSGREALDYLLQNEVAVILVDMIMPEQDGFELAKALREHPRLQKTAMIFISAVQVSDLERLHGYEMGAVDYIPVPVVPELLRAKIRVFTELYRKTRRLERLNAELQDRLRACSAQLERSAAMLVESEQHRSVAVAAGKMGLGSWHWDWINGAWIWDEGQYRIFGVDPGNFELTSGNIKKLLDRDDVGRLRHAIGHLKRGARSWEAEFRIIRPNGEERWCAGTAAATVDERGRVVRLSGVTIDVTESRRAEERQNLLAREVEHRAKNALALAQSIVRLTRAGSLKDYIRAVEGRISALARAHTVLALSSWEGAEIGRLLDEEISPYSTGEQVELDGPELQLEPATAQTLALAVHELITNSAKYGALSAHSGRLTIRWEVRGGLLQFVWQENDGPEVKRPTSRGFGTRSVIASIESQLGGRAEFDWRVQGLVCQLLVPVEKQVTARQSKLHPNFETRAQSDLLALRRRESFNRR